MEISRRNMLRLSVAGGSATALGGLIGSGVNLTSAVVQAQELRIRTAKVTPSVCPFCAVGCATLVHTIDGQIVNIEGDSRSPHNEGTLCPKGAASFELLTHAARATRVKYRAPYANDWQDLDPESALDMIANRVWETRARSFVADRDGLPLMQCPTIAHLGGATLDNEENYLIKKLFAGGLGMVAISNQARI